MGSMCKINRLIDGKFFNFGFASGDELSLRERMCVCGWTCSCFLTCFLHVLHTLVLSPSHTHTHTHLHKRINTLQNLCQTLQTWHRYDWNCVSSAVGSSFYPLNKNQLQGSLPMVSPQPLRQLHRGLYYFTCKQWEPNYTLYQRGDHFALLPLWFSSHITCCLKVSCLEMRPKSLLYIFLSCFCFCFSSNSNFANSSLVF